MITVLLPSTGQGTVVQTHSELSEVVNCNARKKSPQNIGIYNETKKIHKGF